MKNIICAYVGAICGYVVTLLGGWDKSFSTLFIIMVIDFVTGLMVAGVFHKSTKTETGTLESNACFKGLCKKVLIIFFVLIGYRFDIIIGTDYVRDSVCIAFMCSDLISIVENAGLMGVPIPPVIINMIDVLKSREKRKDGD